MIDTVQILIHGLEKYAATVNGLSKEGKNSFTKVLCDTETGEVFENKKAIHVFFHDSSKFLRLNHRSSRYIASSHYELSYLVDFHKDVIRFNFSIPKYKYGHNIAQFINYYSTSSRDQFHLLMTFLKEWLNSFTLQKIDLDDVEIAQIDFCYNQFFNSKEEALTYLDYVYPLFERFSRQNGRSPQRYKKESIMFVTDRYSFKIYHKGSEFRRNDYRELAEKKLNIKFDLKKLASISDRILRYEVSYRSTALTQYFKKLYLTGRDKRGKNSIYREVFKTLNIENGKFANKHFYLASSFDNRITIKYRGERSLLDLKYYAGKRFKGQKDFNAVTFDLTLFNCLYENFWEMVKRFQINSTGSIHSLKERIERIDEMERTRIMLSNNKKAKKSTRLSFWAAVSQKHNLREFVKKGTLAKSTFYRILKEFKKVGLTEYNPQINAPKPDIGYQEYKSLFGSYH